MPNETNWQDITRRLDINEASVTDTCYPKARSKGRAIKKIGREFTIPSLTYNPLAINPAMFFSSNSINGTLITQFNYVAPANFKLLKFSINYPSASNAIGYYIRYREGNTIYRYRLPSLYSIFTDYPSVQAEPYVAQLIKKNFTVEVWAGYVTLAFITTTPAAQTITTNLLSIPANSDSIIDEFAEPDEYTRAEQASTFPEVLPTVYGPNVQWLTNT